MRATDWLVGTALAVAVACNGPASSRADDAPNGTTPAPPRFTVPEGFLVERVAAPPLVRYPLFAALDDRGRLYVAEGTGTNLPGDELVRRKLGRILRLTDRDGDGVFDESTVFADGLVFPTGVLWHDGAVYATSHPSLWRFVDADDDGRADRREALVGRFGFNGNGCDIHGPFLGPDGSLYWTGGRHGYTVPTREGPVLEGFASRVWRARPDGSRIERLCGGGFDNPVELAFTADGALIGTMDQGPGDALLHYVEGGVYPMDHPCVKEFVSTGPMLGAVRQYSAALPVALCGLTAYRSSHLGADYTGGFFTAQFNVHRIEHHRLVPDGSTFRSVERDFVTSDSYDVHLSDVLEDADGTLLFVDMGAWFNYGCPTSKIAKPEVLGGIYRVRRRGGPVPADPWGKSFGVAGRDPAALASLLGAPAFKVRERAVVELAKRGPAAFGVLADVVRSRPGVDGLSPRSPEARLDAVWALARSDDPAALAAVRHGLTDPVPAVRRAAAHVLGLNRDPLAVGPLARMLESDEPAARLKAAESLGRIGNARAVPALRSALAAAGNDRFLEHAAVYALIRINDRGATLPLLDDPSPRVRTAGLVALDQMPAGGLTRDVVVPQLDTDDPDLQEAALRVIARHADWSREVLGLVGARLAQPALAPAQARALEGALLGFCGDATVQRVVADALASPATAAPTRLLLLRVLARCRVDPLPGPWVAAVGRALDDPAAPVRRAAVSVVRLRKIARYDAALTALARRADLPDDLRVAALEAAAGGGADRPLDGPSFAFLLDRLSPSAEPLLRVAAARAAGAYKLDGGQLTRLAGPLADAGPAVVPLLVPAFTRAPVKDPAVARAFLSALRRSPGAAALNTDALAAWLAGLPDEARALAAPLLASNAERRTSRAAYLAALADGVGKSAGDPDRGKAVFFSRKVGCYGCHRAAGQGGGLGPDLSQVGRFRTARDLLESIAFPSSSVVPQFQSYLVSTRDGTVAQGLIVRESDDAVELRTADLAEVRIPRGAIDEVAPSPVSIMPEGLEKTMSRQELSDLLAFLTRQR